jgi:vanillate O-demethylase monooxygenase subunit
MSEQLNSLFPRDCSYSETNWTVLSRFWHVVAFADEVSDEPMSVKLLDVPLVLFRGADGNIVAAHDVCPHRGSLLSQGKVSDGILSCPYHGFQFNGGGQCVHVPSNQPGAKIPEQLHLNLINVREHRSLIWVCLDGDGIVPLPEWPELADGSLQNYHLDAVLAGTSATRFCENFNDVAHFAFVHAGTFGGGCREAVEEHAVAKTDGGLHHELVIEQVDRVSMDGSEEEKTAAHYSYDFTFPFANKMHIKFDETRNQHIYAVASPVSATRCRLHMQFGRDYDLDQPIEESLAFEGAVTAEDLVVIEQISPVESPLDLSEEFHVAADKWSVAFRRSWRAFGLTQ